MCVNTVNMEKHVVGHEYATLLQPTLGHADMCANTTICVYVCVHTANFPLRRITRGMKRGRAGTSKCNIDSTQAPPQITNL